MPFLNARIIYHIILSLPIGWKGTGVLCPPAISNYRKYLVDDIHDARNAENNEVLAKLRAEYDILAPYIDLFKKFPDFIQWDMEICAVSDSLHNTSLPVR